MRYRCPKLAALLIGVLLAGCAQTKAFYRSETLRSGAAQVRVLLMPIDIELYELTAGGLLQPKAEWTTKARVHATVALRDELKAKNAELIVYQPPTDMPVKSHAHDQLLKLHEVVGKAILEHKYNFQLALPTKEDKFDWSLGQGVNVLREDYGAQYALFVHMRDSYASGGRVAVIILAAALLGVTVSGGMQLGFASLVDLESGNVLWFNRLISEIGDLRTPEPAQKAVKQLLAEFPL